MRSINKQIKFLFLTTVLLCGVFVASCSEENAKSEEHLLKVNDYTLTESSFNTMLKFELDADRSFDLSGDTRVSFLNDLIRKQLLIQEAQQYNLDREEKFRKTIQRYWESTLIRNLLNKKGTQFREETAVTAEQVRGYFEENKDDFGGQSFDDVNEEIVELIEQEKVGLKMAKWIDSLVDDANIDISDPELSKKVKNLNTDDY